MKIKALFISLFFVSAAFAQVQEDGLIVAKHSKYGSEQSFLHTVRVGPLVGYSTLGMSGGSISPGEANSVPSGGILVDIGSGFLQFQTGVVYFHSNGTETFDLDPGTNGQKLTGMTKYSLDYVGVPLIGKISVFDSPNSSFYVKAGTIITNLVSSSSKSMQIDVVGNSAPYDDPYADGGWHSMDYLGVIGIGGTTPLTRSMSFVLDINYLRSLSQVRDDMSTFNEGFGVSMGIAIGI